MLFSPRTTRPFKVRSPVPSSSQMLAHAVHSCAGADPVFVKNHEASGDTVAGGFSNQQAFLALIQGDAAADHIAAEISGKAATLNYKPMSMCVMEELNRATFAQVPLKYTGDPLKPVDVSTEDPEHIRLASRPSGGWAKRSWVPTLLAIRSRRAFPCRLRMGSDGLWLEGDVAPHDRLSDRLRSK